MTKTGADFTWFETGFPDLAEAYCLTWVRGPGPAELVTRLGGTPAAPVRGAKALVDAAFDMPGAFESADPLVGLTRVGEWTLLVEPNGYLGITEPLALPASAGATWVSHFENINGVASFLWAEDGGLRLCFDPVFPDDRTGPADSPELVAVMRRIGFRFEEDGDTDEDFPPVAFALAEHLTGAALTPELLRDTEFLCATVPAYT